MTVTEPTVRRLRADAQRNYDTLLAAAHAVFQSEGADAPMEHVAREAGASQGTLYRHFPTRDHLLAAMVQDRSDRLEAEAQDGLEVSDTWGALVAWLHDYVAMGDLYRGLSARIGHALADPTSPVATQCRGMKAAFSALLTHAQDQGLVRADVTSAQVLALVSALPKDQATNDTDELYFDIVLAGLSPS